MADARSCSIEPTEPLAHRLERGEVVVHPVCPFAVPTGDAHSFLLDQRLASRAHKNISYDPNSGRANGYQRRTPEQAERLTRLLADFARHATAWLSAQLPTYAVAWKLDRVSYRPVEESTRKARLKARNDLLHVDAFPSRPSQGYRILRLFVNVNPSQDRVWATTYPFAELLARYGTAAGLPDGSIPIKSRLLSLFRPGKPRRSPYDEFMLRFHDWLKASPQVQIQDPRTIWRFAPGTAWMAMTDTCSHAVLSGRFALEHSYFIAPQSLALPKESPPALLEAMCGRPVLRAA
ncbi:MAG: Kdo hydroxylase family protein [Gemmataceae bacterium]